MSLNTGNENNKLCFSTALIWCVAPH